MPIFICLIIIIILFTVAKWIIVPLFKYTTLMTENINDSVFKGLIEFDKTVITICSAAIIFTLQLIDKSIEYKQYLVISWIGFILSIIFGVIILLVCYAGRVTYKVSSKHLSLAIDKAFDINKSERDKTKEEGIKITKHIALLNKTLVILILLLLFLFCISFLFMIIFGLNNL